MRRLLVIKHQIVHGITTPPDDVLASLKASWSADEWSQFQGDMQRRSKDLESSLRGDGLWDDMTDAEQLFIASPLLERVPQQAVNVSWLMESAACLLWALKYCDAIPPFDVEANPELLKTVPNERGRTLSEMAELRPDDEIESARSVAELWHWRSRTRQMQEQGGHESQLPKGLTFRDVVSMTSEMAAENGAIPRVLDADFPAFGKPYRDATAEEYITLTSIAMERHRALNWLRGYAPRNRWDETPTDT